MDTRWTEGRLIAAMSRDGSKPTTLDYPAAYDRQLLQLHAANGPAAGAGAAPTEAQLAILRDYGVIDDLPPAATWVHASLLVDGILGTPQGDQARQWLRETGAPADEAGRAVDMAMRDVVASSGVSRIRQSAPRRETQAQSASHRGRLLPDETVEEVERARRRRDEQHRFDREAAMVRQGRAHGRGVA